jgi:hypothetical protein
MLVSHSLAAPVHERRWPSLWSAPQLPGLAAMTSQGAMPGVSTVSCPKVGQCLALGYGVSPPCNTPSCITPAPQSAPVYSSIRPDQH